MTQTTERSLAKMIAGDPHPLGRELPRLQAKAARLFSAVRTAEKWGDVCMADNSPTELFGVGDSEISPRTRYSLMGALPGRTRRRQRRVRAPEPTPASQEVENRAGRGYA